MIIYWLTVSVLLPYGAIFQKPIESLSDGATQTIMMANFLAVTALISYLFGINVILRNVFTPSIDKLAKILLRYNAKRIFTGYLIYTFITTIFGKIFLGFAGGQLLISFIFFKWAFLTFLITYVDLSL
jgi:hypothetical protein